MSDEMNSTKLGGEGSNLQHPASKADVLPIELPPKDASADSMQATTKEHLAYCLVQIRLEHTASGIKVRRSADRSIPDCATLPVTVMPAQLTFPVQ